MKILAVPLEPSQDQWRDTVTTTQNRKHTLRDESPHLFPRISALIQGDSERALQMAASHSELDRPKSGNQIRLGFA